MLKTNTNSFCVCCFKCDYFFVIWSNYYVIVLNNRFFPTRLLSHRRGTLFFFISVRLHRKTIVERTEKIAISVNSSPIVVCFFPYNLFMCDVGVMVSIYVQLFGYKLLMMSMLNISKTEKIVNYVTPIVMVVL